MQSILQITATAVASYLLIAPLNSDTAFAADTTSAIHAPNYKVRQLVPPSDFHGVHGLAFDSKDQLYAGSVTGQTTYRVDKKTGRVITVVAPPEGMADDLIFLPDGTMVWTSISQNMVRAKKGDGPVRVLASNLASVNSIAYRKSDNRLFVAQVFGGDGLWEVDISGEKPARNILKDMGGLNGFDIGPDGWIYGPLWFKHQVVKINPDTAELIVITDKFDIPAAANFDSKWNLYVLDTARGEVVRVDIHDGATKVVAKLEASLDNLAIDSKDHIYVSNMADNGIQEIDVRSGKARQVIKGHLSAPRSIAVATDGNHDTIYVADNFAYRSVDGDSGNVTTLDRVFAANTKVDYSSNVWATNDYVLLGTRGLQQYDRRSGALQREIRDLRGIANMRVLADGSVIATQAGSLIRFDLAHDSERKVVAKGLTRPGGVAIASPNSAYVSEVSAGKILLFNLDNGESKVIASDLQSPQGIAMAVDGSLLVVELGKQRLLSVDVHTGALTEIATHLPIGLLPSNAPPAPVGLAVSQAGAIYITSDIENSIYKLMPRANRAR